MSQIADTSPLPIPADVAGKLRGLRRRITTWFLVDGITRVLFWLFVLINIDFHLDWIFRMDRPQRGIMLVLSLAILAFIVVMRLVRPLLTRPSDEALCLAVEDRFGELQGSLIGAVQLARIADVRAVGASPSLVEATINLGTRQAKGLDFGAILNRRGVLFGLIALLLLTTTMAWIVSVRFGNTVFSLWYRRNVLLADQPWPWDTYLVVTARRRLDAERRRERAEPRDSRRRLRRLPPRLRQAHRDARRSPARSAVPDRRATSHRAVSFSRAEQPVAVAVVPGGAGGSSRGNRS
jgi:hypothetical protein